MSEAYHVLSFSGNTNSPKSDRLLALRNDTPAALSVPYSAAPLEAITFWYQFALFFHVRACV